MLMALQVKACLESRAHLAALPRAVIEHLPERHPCTATNMLKDAQSCLHQA